MNAIEERTAQVHGPAIVNALLATVSSRPIMITNVQPEIDNGRFAVKRTVGDTFIVRTTVFKDGHDRLTVMLLWKRHEEPDWHETPMTVVNPGLDVYEGHFLLEYNTYYLYTVEAWVDIWESWCEELQKKLMAEQEVSLELIEGRLLVEETLSRANNPDRQNLAEVLRQFEEADYTRRCHLLLSEYVKTLMKHWADRSYGCRYDRVLELFVDRVSARYAAWYEMFHRSQGTRQGKSATFHDCARRLPEIRALGFDVIYLVPIHPIGRTHRKGPNNALTVGPNDPGSPYAIGAVEGGHTAIHPDLGTLDDFRHFVHIANTYGLEVALDFAIQCSPDHPWVKEAPQWFQFRPDGTIKYAENPPKKYQDIVNVDFYNPDAINLWKELLNVVLFWIEQGIKIFRVDNPHTKPLPFWEWMIRTVRCRHPEVIFLSEAFTRPPMMKTLAKIGFSQSYSYFTWRNFKWELTEYLTELTQSDVAEYMRPNLFPNTPDILPEFLQKGGRPAFMIRFILAATLSPVYGLYNGFELCENKAVPGKEEYCDSEKYAYKVWDWDRFGNIKSLITTVNRIRRENTAFHELANLQFHVAHDDNILFYSKISADRSNVVLIAVNLDPFDVHECTIEVPLSEIGLSEQDNYAVQELISGEKHLWSGVQHRIRLDPQTTPAFLLHIIPWRHVDFESPSW
ncbi:Alpha-amylase [invertebrate metagenome]|uniref:starch synthase (maltosyl-transferring) n=1 Tax=invertebrate metagenome TaxID=1711999 RepID=A0A484H6S7_9ZZZZ